MGRRIATLTLAAALLAGAGVACAQVAAQEAASTVTVASAPAPAAAAPSPPAQSTAAVPVKPFAGAAAGSLLQTIFALCVVLGLLALLAWAMKRWGPKAAGGSAHVRMVGGLNLGGRERIIVVEVGEQWIVVGASPGRVNALATMPRQTAGAVDPAALALHQAPANNFADWLKQTIAQRKAE